MHQHTRGKTHGDVRVVFALRGLQMCMSTCTCVSVGLMSPTREKLCSHKELPTIDGHVPFEMGRNKRFLSRKYFSLFI